MKNRSRKTRVKRESMKNIIIKQMNYKMKTLYLKSLTTIKSKYSMIKMKMVVMGNKTKRTQKIMTLETKFI